VNAAPRPAKFSLVGLKRQTAATGHFRLAISLTASILVALTFEVMVTDRVAVDPTRAAESTFTSVRSTPL